MVRGLLRCRLADRFAEDAEPDEGAETNESNRNVYLRPHRTIDTVLSSRVPGKVSCRASTVGFEGDSRRENTGTYRGEICAPDWVRRVRCVSCVLLKRIRRFDTGFLSAV
jgi:hypothetical protein